jgi:hypothetical protein
VIPPRVCLRKVDTRRTGPGPDLRRLALHVVNLENQGRLSTTGKFVSTPAQINRAFEHMGRWHDLWLRNDSSLRERHVLLYAHGGLNAEDLALRSAEQNLNWWLNNRVYPLFFAWQSGPAETLLDHLADTVKGRLPFGLGFDFSEQADRAVELVARASFRWMWDEMKENARAASGPINDQRAIAWPLTSSSAQTAMAAMPGASLTVLRLAEYIRQHPDQTIRVHLVGHSAGAIFHAALLQRLVDAAIPVASMALLAPAIRVNEFARDILPHLGVGQVDRFTTFNLSDRRELDDVCGAGGIDVYRSRCCIWSPGRWSGATQVEPARCRYLACSGSSTTRSATVAGQRSRTKSAPAAGTACSPSRWRPMPTARTPPRMAASPATG